MPITEDDYPDIEVVIDDRIDGHDTILRMIANALDNANFVTEDWVDGHYATFDTARDYAYDAVQDNAWDVVVGDVRDEIQTAIAAAIADLPDPNFDITDLSERVDALQASVNRLTQLMEKANENHQADRDDSSEHAVLSG